MPSFCARIFAGADCEGFTRTFTDREWESTSLETPPVIGFIIGPLVVLIDAPRGVVPGSIGELKGAGVKGCDRSGGANFKTNLGFSGGKFEISAKDTVCQRFPCHPIAVQMGKTSQFSHQHCQKTRSIEQS